MHRGVMILLGFFTVFGFTPILSAEQVGLLPVPVLQNVQVQAQVIFDSGTGLYSYSYTIANPVTNTGEIDGIHIDITQLPNRMALSSEGLTIPFGIKTRTFDEVLGIGMIDPAPMVPVGIQVPQGWYGDLGAAGYATFNDNSDPPFTKCTKSSLTPCTQ